MNEIVGSCDILFITLDTLRYDVAVEEMREGRTPNIARIIPDGWEKRHSPGSFTYASHCAFFAGFLPTPAKPGVHERLFSLKFAGSETTGSSTYSFDTENIIEGFEQEGYATFCIGGVGFFKKENPLSCVLPNMFQESYWQKEFGVTDPHSTQNQVTCALNILKKRSEKLFLFMNISALHQPNYFYLAEATSDTIHSHAAALRYIDTQLEPLFEALAKRARDTFAIITSDHGTTYGEDGFTGHRLAHENVWNIPFATALIKGTK